MKFAHLDPILVSFIGVCAGLAIAGCGIGGGLPVGPAAVQIDLGEFALGKDGALLNFELGDALIGAIPLCEVIAATDFDEILREEVDSSIGSMVSVTEVILTSIVLRFPSGLPAGAETLTLLFMPAGSGISSIGAPSRIGSADFRAAANGAIEIFAESELDLLPLLESEEGAPCPLLLIVLEPFASGEAVLLEAVLNADAYGEISLGFTGDAAPDISNAEF